MIMDGPPRGSTGRYALELAQLQNTYAAALQASTMGLRSAITAANQASLIGVGSGGSFTVASLLCNFHEAHTGRISRPATPLEIMCNPTLASTSPAVFVSAEGKNPDIVEALVRARQRSARPIHVLTNREQSPLIEAASKLRDITLHVHPLVQKDGYLATNSLLFDCMLVSRAYAELRIGNSLFPTSYSELKIGGGSVAEWVAAADDFARDCASKQSLIIVFSPSLRPIAADIESKLAESALMHVQLADQRSFSHGRHLWLSSRAKDCAILALVDSPLEQLWEHMKARVPLGIPVLALSAIAPSAPGMVAALVAAMELVGLLAKWLHKDPGRPVVAPFGRELYYADVTSLVPAAPQSSDDAEEEKLAVLGTHWPHVPNRAAIRRARQVQQQLMGDQLFRAVVFDYDGTLRTTQQEDGPPAGAVIRHLSLLLESKIGVAIVSGRGNSLHTLLRDALPPAQWSVVHLGLYNGGWIGTLVDEVEVPERGSEFLNHVCRIARKLQAVGVPIKAIKPTPPYQCSIRFHEGVDTEGMWFVLGDALRQAGLTLSGMVRSRHSIDVLEPGISKSRVIASLIQKHGYLPHHILAMGDQGAWPGNDAGLLEHRFSLSVDLPSRRLDRGWKLAPLEKRGVDATLWYLDRIIKQDSGGFRIAFEEGGNDERGNRTTTPGDGNGMGSPRTT